MQSYLGWTKRTAEPQSITAQIFSLCRLPTLPERRFVESEHGKDQLLLQDWLNPLAVQGFQVGGKPAFPRGSAIVKQKLRRAADGKLEVAALGLMIKQGQGFDPAHGDWEYGYWEADSGLSAGEAVQTHCGDCHKASSSDHVFVESSWRIPRETP